MRNSKHDAHTDFARRAVAARRRVISVIIRVIRVIRGEFSIQKFVPATP
jgi:hypothetical protein